MNVSWRRLNNVHQTVRRGDIFYANLNPVIGSEQGGVRPVLILQNNIGNKYSPTTIIAAITSQIKKGKLPTHVELSAAEFNLDKDSVILLEQVRTIDKRRLKEKIAHLDEEIMSEIDRAIMISLGLVDI
ncbi:MAG: type II toxin-antitoxin system PemK/MazF family toxin [Candidatus Wallacebacter cryptica]|nr:type II toxin-antitoxin system PemK/MazF family toxin [Bacillota bacterium]